MSLPKQYRVAQIESYESALKKGSMVRCGPFKVFTGAASESRLGVVVPKKQMQLSHDRHRLRRRIHDKLVQYPLTNTMVVVMLCQKVDPEYNLDDLEKTLKTLFQRQYLQPVKDPIQLLDDAIRTNNNVDDAVQHATLYIQRHPEYCDIHHAMHQRYRELMQKYSDISVAQSKTIKTTPEA